MAYARRLHHFFVALHLTGHVIPATSSVMSLRACRYVVSYTRTGNPRLQPPISVRRLSPPVRTRLICVFVAAAAVPHKLAHRPAQSKKRDTTSASAIFERSGRCCVVSSFSDSILCTSSSYVGSSVAQNTSTKLRSVTQRTNAYISKSPQATPLWRTVSILK